MITITPYDSGGNAVTSLSQWDYGITIYLSASGITSNMSVHFANVKKGTAYAVVGEYSDGTLSAAVPDIVLQAPTQIFGYVFDGDDDTGKAIYQFTIDITRRAKPLDYVETDNVTYVTLSNAIASGEDAAASAQESATAAAASAQAAAESESNASSSETAAASSAQAAQTSESNAQVSEESASESAASAAESLESVKSIEANILTAENLFKNSFTIDLATDDGDNILDADGNIITGNFKIHIL